MANDGQMDVDAGSCGRMRQRDWLAPAQADITDTLSSPQKGRPAGPQYESPGPVA